MPSLRDIEFAAIDFESAGARPGGTDVPVQAGVAILAGGEIRPELGFQSYIASTEPVTWRARKVHGITDEDLKEAPTMSALWPEFRNRLGGRWVVAHGASTERRFLRAFPFHGFGPWIDTLKLARAIAPSLSSHTLGDLVTHFGLQESLETLIPDFRWHDAYCDALGSLALLKHFLSDLDLWQASPEVLLLVDDSPFHRHKAGLRAP
jgi:DNA polymerase-3 subunit epsilon